MEDDAGAEEGLVDVGDAVGVEVGDEDVEVSLRLLRPPELLPPYDPEKPSFLQLFVDDVAGAVKGLDDVDDVVGDEEGEAAGPRLMGAELLLILSQDLSLAPLPLVPPLALPPYAFPPLPSITSTLYLSLNLISRFLPLFR